MDVVEFIKILNEKRKISVILIVTGLIVGLLAYFVLPPIYETRTTFMVLESKLIRRSLEGKKLDIDTYLNFVNNDSLYHDIYKRLDIQKKYGMDFDKFKRSFEVTTVEDTAIIKLIVSFQSPEISFKIAKILGDKALALNRKVINKEVHSGYRFTEAQVEAASTQLETARTSLDNFLAQYPVLQMAMEIDTLKNRIAIEENGELAVFPPMESATLVNNLTPQITQSGATPKVFSSLARIQTAISQAESRLAVAKADNRKIDVSRQLKELKILLKRKHQTLQRLNTHFHELEKTYLPLKSQFEALRSEFIAAQKGYEKIYQTALESKIEIVGKTKEMTIIDGPVIPDQPTFPKVIFMLIGGLFLGLLSDFLFIILVGFNRKLDHA